MKLFNRLKRGDAARAESVLEIKLDLLGIL